MANHINNDILNINENEIFRNETLQNSKNKHFDKTKRNNPDDKITKKV